MQEEHFPFLKPPDNTRHRTTFYTALARLLFMSESADAFARFMEPINHVLTALKTTVHVRSEKVMHGLIGVCRDLRGIVAATNSRRTYSLVFDALFPAHFDLFSKAIMVGGYAHACLPPACPVLWATHADPRAVYALHTRLGPTLPQ